jgi:hypothetical protein
VKTFLIAATLLLSVPRLAGAAEFRYSMPTGFTHISRYAPAANLHGLPPEMLKQARAYTQSGALFEDGVPVAAVMVTVEEGTRAIDESVDGVVKVASQRSGFRLLTKELVTIQGVTCGKVEFVTRAQDLEIQKLTYLLPLGSERAWVALEAEPARFTEVRPQFEASIAAVSGLRPASDPSANAAIGTLALAALVGAGLSQLRRRRARR